MRSTKRGRAFVDLPRVRLLLDPGVESRGRARYQRARPRLAHHDGKIVMRQWVDDGYRRIPAGPDGFLRTRLPSQCKIGAVRPDKNRTSREHSIVATLGHVTETAGSSPEDELTPAPPGLFRYHAGGNMVLGAGVATG